MEFLTRVNYGLAVGNFEIDLDDGEVRFKTSLDAEGSEIGLPLIERLVYANVAAMDQFLPGLMKTVEERATPCDAIAACE